MQGLELPQWTLDARLEGSTLEILLSDGRRMALRVRRDAGLLRHARALATAAEVVGDDLARRLASSRPRPLSILYEGDPFLDGVEWERLDLGPFSMAEHFALSRQILSDTDLPPAQTAGLADALDLAVLHDGVARTWVPATAIAFGALHHEVAVETVANAHVLVLDGVSLSQWLDFANSPRQQRLVVLAGSVSTRDLSRALDTGACVLRLAHSDELTGDCVESLVRQLDIGASVGEAVRGLHRRHTPRHFDGRLYGPGEMCFVRPQAPASLRQVTSLSYDLVGSTSMLAALGGETYADTLADVHARCRDVMRRHGGYPDDPQGNDGVMCYFGHPSALEGAAVHAVAAGLAIVRAVAELGAMVRVGIATGWVAIRAGQPFDLSIHLAARLQQAAAPGTVLLAAATHKLVAHAFELSRLVDRPLLKGIDASGDVYLVLGPRSDSQELRVERPADVTPLVARQAELDRLHACWHATRAGRGRPAVILGEAGMGKSRLVREFRHQLVQAGVKVLECRCRSDASSSPFLTLSEALRRWLDIGPGESSAQALHKLAAALPANAREGEPLSLLAAVLGLAPQQSRPGPGISRQRVVSTLVDWFKAFAGNRPSCLIVEDWQWVDPSMREFVEHLVERSGDPALQVVITVRSEAATRPFPTISHECIELLGLSPDAASQLVEHICADTPLPPRMVNLLAARGDGVPLFLEEAARMALELRSTRPGEEQRALESVPASLRDLLAARLDALNTAKPVAQVAAVLGRQFSRSLLAALLDAAGYVLELATLDDRLATLVASGLIRLEADGRFAFRHVLIRDEAYDSLWKRDRRRLHEQVVHLLQDRWPELAGMQPELLALHQTAAGLHVEAVAQWELAARHAAARSAELEAISHLNHALEELRHTEPGMEHDRTALRLQLLLAARLLATEGYGADAVLQAYLEAQRLCDRSGDDMARFKVEMGLEAYRFMRADFTPALEHGNRAAAIAVRTGDIRQRLNAHWGLACTLFHQGDLRATMREMETALALYSPAMHSQFAIQDPGVMCMAYSSWGLWELGRPDAALARINEAVAMAHRFEHRFSQAVAMAYAVSIELLRGEYDAALVRAEACMRICEDFGFPVWLAITRCMHGYLLCEHGRFQAGLTEMTAGYSQWLGTGAMVSQPLYLSLQVQGLMLAGDLEAAAARVNEGLAIINRYGERQLEAELVRLQGELLLRLGDVTSGEASLKRAYVLALRRRRLAFALRSANALAKHWAAHGLQDRARRVLVPLAARWNEGRGTRDLREASAVIESLH